MGCGNTGGLTTPAAGTTMRRLAGDQLVAGEYEPIRINEEPDGVKWGHSPVLGLDLCWEEGQLRVYDPVAEAYLLPPEELEARRAAAEARAAGAEGRAAAERAARQLAEDRAVTAESELRRLQERLRRLQAE